MRFFFFLKKIFKNWNFSFKFNYKIFFTSEIIDQYILIVNYFENTKIIYEYIDS